MKIPVTYDHSKESETAQRVYKVLADMIDADCKPEDFSREMRLRSELNMDDLDYTEIMPALEDEFGFEISGKDIEKVEGMEMVGEIIDYAEGRLAESEATS